MATIHLHLASSPRLLLERAADGFLTPLDGGADGGFPSPDYLLVLRQGGLREDLFRLAAERGVRGWFDPPLCVVHELPGWLGETGRRPLGDYERAAFLGSVLRRTAGDVLARVRRPEAFLEAVDRLFGELVAEGVTPDGFEAALAARRGRDGFERRRDDELAAAYRLYLGDLERAGRRDGRDDRTDCARAVREHPEETGRRLGGRREIRLVGLQDLRGWRPLLRALCASPVIERVSVYTSVALDFGDGFDVEVKRLDAGDSVAVRLFRPEAEAAGAAEPEDDATGPAEAPRIAGLAAPDAEREAEEVARRVRALVDAGVAPHRIAVVSRQARPYMDLAVAALERFGLPVTARRRIAYEEIPVVRGVLALFAAAAEGWTRHGLVELAEQPYLGGELDPRVLNHIGYRRRVRGLSAWAKAMDELLEAARAHEARLEAGEEPEERGTPPPPAWRVERARDAFRAFRGRAGELDRTRTLAEWVEWMAGWVEEDAWQVEERIYDVPLEHVRLARADLAGWRGLQGILAEWRDALVAWGGGDERLDARGFERRLREMLTGDVALWTETDRGVQVLEALAAAYCSFDHVFLLGLEAGRFPLHPPRSPLLDEVERRELVEAGLPLELHEDWEAREQELFRALVAGADRLTVSWAQMDAEGREVLTSAYVEALAEVAGLPVEEIPTARVRTPGMPLSDPGVREHARFAATIERARETGRPSRWNGRIEDEELVAWLAEEFGDDRLWSPTQLEAYAKCPWAFFSGRLLRLEKLEDPDEDMDPAVRGTVLHDALRRFYDAAVERIGGPVFLRAEDRTWAEPALLDALDAALADAEEEMWLGHDALRDARRAELRRILAGYLEWEIQHNEDMYAPRKRKAPKILRTGVAEHEKAFRGVMLELDGVRVKFRGFVDRVERGVDERIDAGRFLAAVDYKTSKYAAPGGGDKDAWADGVVLQVPLYAYALERLYDGAMVSRVEYRALRQQEAVHSLQLYQVDKKKGVLIPDDDAREQMEGALRAVAGHVKKMRQGEFPARPAPSCACPPFCHAWDVCRVAGGPRTKFDR